MQIQFTELMMEMSRVLDFVETEQLGVQSNHGKRVAYLCALLGEKAGLSKEERLDLAAYAVLHDHALLHSLKVEEVPEILATSQDREPNTPLIEALVQLETKGTDRNIIKHCVLGERNMVNFPFFHPQDHAILYHHENADGSGPLGKTSKEINFYAALIHIADLLDLLFALKDAADDSWKNHPMLQPYVDSSKWKAIHAFVQDQTGKLFGEREATLFLDHVTVDVFDKLQDSQIESALPKLLKYKTIFLHPDQLIAMSALFAEIVDYKSTFTSKHSIGIAQKAYRMAQYYGLSAEKQAELYFAGAVHDIGKLGVDLAILEKPDKLTLEEFEEMKKHALITYEVLSKIHGMEEISKWAAYHHEKLNGNGYPFGYSAKDLGKYERLMGCLDIYQALREDRPYKAGMTHEATMGILRSMVVGGFIDEELTQDVDRVFADS
ncbi:MAG: HD domain-containing protein [Clostridium sp.]|jgi:HD-GYP domain-containing protein (c-di-GMP phosphodiesterase class II)|nr:HD domain-containing protein [Clostridium sp.]